MITRSKTALLTERQCEVLGGMAEGETIKTLSRKLHLSEKTVEYHYAAARRHIGEENLARVTQWALKHRVARRVVGLALGWLLLPASWAAELQWDAVTDCGVTNYLVYKAEFGSTNFVLIGQTTNTTFTLTNGYGASYCVRSQNPVALSDRSQVVTNWVPARPENVRIEIKLLIQ